MHIADELRKLQELHWSGALNDEEFARAKRAVLERGGGAAPEGGVVQEQLDHLRQQNELLRLDQEWQGERERYMVSGRDGHRYLPTKGMSVLGGVVITVFGIGWTAFAASFPRMDHAPGVFQCFPLFGVVFVLIGIGVSVYQYNKAGGYEQAEASYRRRRQEILDRGTEPPGPGPAAGPPDDRITGG